MPYCCGCWPRGICSAPGCHPSSQGDLLGQNALCSSHWPQDSQGNHWCSTFRAAQSNFACAMLVLFIPRSFQMQGRCSAGSPWPHDLQAKEQRQLKVRLEAPKSSARGLETASALHRAGDGAPCLALPIGSENLSVLCRSWLVGLQPDQTVCQLQIVCPLPLLCPGFLSLPLFVCLFATYSASPSLI